MIISKRSIPPSKSSRLINHGPVILVSSLARMEEEAEPRTSIITLAWNTVLSKSPPLVGIVVGSSRYSHELIEASREFVINIPTIDLIEQTWGCGTLSGRATDKFDRFGLAPQPATCVAAPLIGDCPGHLECRLAQSVRVGDHTMFVGEVVAACADPALFTDHWLEGDDGVPTIHHLGGSLFVGGGRTIDVKEM